MPPAAGLPDSPPPSATPAGHLLTGTLTRLADPPALLQDGRVRLVLHPRERELEAVDARTGRRLGRIPAGVGPTDVAADGGNLAYLVDSVGEALLVVRLRPRLEITRRVHLPGRPHAIAVDRPRNRLWVTAPGRNQLVMLSAGARPGERERYASVRRPQAVAVDEARGRVLVSGQDGRLQVLDVP